MTGRQLTNSRGVAWLNDSTFALMMNKLRTVFTFLASCVLLGAATRGAETHYQPNWSSLDQRPCPQWYLNAKFGIFIAWGLYSVPGWGAPKSYAEWYWHNIANHEPGNVWWQHQKELYGTNFTYPDFAPLFKAQYFNPDQWADLFYRSGAKYVVQISKHHDGFCLWPSVEADRDWGRPWNAVSTGPHRDLLGDLAKAVRRRGLRFGIYYSLYEWFNPIWLTNRTLYVTRHMIPQFKDVVTRYRPAVIFSDGEWDLTAKQWHSEQLLAWLFNDSPCKNYVVVDDRWGNDTRHKHGTYYTTEYGAGMANATHPWEENRGMGYSYGWNRAENINDYRTGRELVLMLVDLVSRGGNFLLDIGPTGDGRIPVIMQDRLIQIGNWLRVNGEAIYDTRFAGRSCQWSAGKRPGQAYGDYKVKYDLMQQIGFAPKNGIAVKEAFFTKKPNALYAITPGWPGRQLVLRDVAVPPDAQVTLLGWPKPLAHRIAGHTLTIQLPQVSSDQLPCEYAYAFKITGASVLPKLK